MSEWDGEALLKVVERVAATAGESGIGQFFRFLSKHGDISIEFVVDGTGLYIRASVKRDGQCSGEMFDCSMRGVFQCLCWLKKRASEEKDCCRQAREERANAKSRYNTAGGMLTGYKTRQADEWAMNSEKCNRCGKPLDKEE